MLEVCSISVDDNIVKVKLLQRPTTAQLKSIIDELDEKYPFKRRLWDYSAIRFDLKESEIQEVAEYAKKKQHRPDRLAFYAPKDFEFGTMRQYEAYRDDPEGSATRVFRNEQEAIEWLKLP